MSRADITASILLDSWSARRQRRLIATALATDSFTAYYILDATQQ